MIPWWVGAILLVGGIGIGTLATAICSGNWEKEEERKKQMLVNLGLIYPENKKAADAGTSTAARKTGGKD